MKPGQRVLDRFALEQPWPGVGELVRWQARDDATGQAAGLTPLPAAGALRPGAASRFRRAWDRPVPHPALVEPLAQGTVDGRPAAAHVPLQPIDPALRLDADQARAWAAWLAPAALAAEPALAGELGPVDLAVDAEGTLRLAPSGLTPPSTELSPPYHRAPELRGGGAPVPGSALYGLGVLLFRAVTGAWPVEARTAAALAQAGPPRRLRELDPSQPDALDHLLAGLLSPDPAVRVAAASTLPPGEPVAVAAGLRVALPSPPAPLPVDRPEARPARQPLPPVARLDLPTAPWVVAARSASLTAAGRRRAAALLDLPEPVVEQAATGSAWLPLEGAQTRAQADERAAFLARQGLQVVARDGAGSGGAWAGSALLGVLALGLAAAALIATPLTWLVAAALGLVAVLLAAGAARQAVVARQRAALRQARRALVARPPLGPVQRLAADLRGARREILEGDLSPPLRLHLEEAAEDLQRRLEHLPADPGPELITGLRASIVALRAAVAEQAAAGGSPAEAPRAADPLAAVRAAARELGS
ncbi:hypothetical protein L6R53_04555 [Myxococcota bacterium]|nr:hypothetical protein [Myxococcota bacterium]